MANLDNLNFEVILKSDAFEQQIKRVQALADAFNLTMTQALTLTGIKGGASNVRELTKELKGAQAAQLALNAAVKASPGEKIVIRHRNAITATNSKMFEMARLLRTLGTLTGGAFSIVGLRRFLSTLIDVTGQFEVQKMALRTMLQDIDAADKIFQDLYRFSSDSTYRFSELAKYSKQLAAFNISKDSLLETTKMLGDVASGVGVSMDRLILAYGHVKSSGFLRGIQLRSFSQNGVPILDELAKMFTEIEGHAVTLGDVFDKMTKREIPFEMVEEAFRRMTSEGGKFYKMQEVLSKTLAGQINILKGRWENLMYAIGQSQEGFLKGTVTGISNLIANYEELGRLVKQVIVIFGAYKVTQIAILSMTDKVAFANLRLVKTFNAIKVANPYVAMAAAIAAVAFVITREATALSNVEKIQRTATKGIEEYNNAINSEIGELDALYARLKFATEGTEEFDSAKKAIQSRFGTYIDQLRQEGVEVNDLAAIYANLSDKIRDATKSRYIEQVKGDLLTNYNNASKDIEKRFNGVISDIEKGSRKLTEDEKYALWMSISGAVDADNAQAVAEIWASLSDDLQRGRKVTTGIGGAQGAVAGVHTQNLNFQERLDDLTREFSSVTDAYIEGVNSAEAAFSRMNALVSTDKSGDEAVYKLSSIVEGLKKIDAEIERIRSKARAGSITATEKDKLDKLVAEREEAAKEYKAIMGVDYDKDIKAGSKAADSAIQREIATLNKEASALREYAEAYEMLRPFLKDQTKDALEKLFNRQFVDTDFNDQIDKVIVRLSELGEKGEEAAKSLAVSLGRDDASKLKKSLEAKQKAAEMLEEYLKKEYDIEGEGVAAKISKILADLANQNTKSEESLENYIKKLDEQERAEKEIFKAGKKDYFERFGFDENRQEAAAEIYWQTYREEQIKAWKEKMRLEQAANKKLSNEKIVGLADDLFKSMTGGMDLTNFNDKTISQLETIRAGLLSLAFPATIAEAIEDPDTLARFSDALDLLQSNAIAKVDLVLGEKKVGAAQRLARAFQGIGSSLIELGEASGNEVLVGMGKVLSTAEEIAGILSENESLMKSISGTTSEVTETAGDLAKSADWITMIVKLVIVAIKEVASSIEEDEQRIKRVVDAIREAKDIMYDESISSGVDTIFGKNFVQQIENTIATIKDLDDAMAKTRQTWEAKGFAFMASGSYIKGTEDKASAINNTVLTERTGWFGRRDFTLMEEAEKLGYDLLDAYGNINVKLLEAIKNTYKLDDTSLKWIDDMILYVGKFEEAMSPIEEKMRDMFGDIASSAAEAVVDGWVEAGKAALDYTDILDDVAKSYAKMVLESAIVGDIFDDERIKEITSKFMSNDYGGAMEMIAEDMDKIAGMEPVFDEIMKVFDPYLKTGEGSETLANGIKGITEDTAGLLASYINAIRADVSFIRMMEEKGWRDVSAISGALPTLNDYMAQVAASNADIARTNQLLLTEIQGVITSSSGRRALAVDVQ